MRFSITSLLVPFILIGGTALASPIDDRSPSKIDTRADAFRPVVVPATSVPIAHPDVALPKAPWVPTTTSPNTGLHSLSISLADSVILCAPHDCASCVAYALSGLTTNVCYTPPSAWYSAIFYTASGLYPGYNLYTSTTISPHCGNSQYMGINVCTNVAGGVSGFDFYLQ